LENRQAQLTPHQLEPAGAARFKGKVVIDVSNPLVEYSLSFAWSVHEHSHDNHWQPIEKGGSVTMREETWQPGRLLLC
jgi:hypothetical protein